MQRSWPRVMTTPFAKSPMNFAGRMMRPFSSSLGTNVPSSMRPPSLRPALGLLHFTPHCTTKQAISSRNAETPPQLPRDHREEGGGGRWRRIPTRGWIWPVVGHEKGRPEGRPVDQGGETPRSVSASTARLLRAGGHRETQRRSHHEHDAGEHRGEAEHTDERLADDDARHEQREPDENAHGGDDDRGAVGTTPSSADRRDVVGLAVIEAALHLVEEALLLFRKRHLELLQASGDAGVAGDSIVGTTGLTRLGACLGVRG